eukprot:CCRYP_002267-RB/>CCRYP_002267-RB protein AED:0.36 eAED:0.36 QI:316/1/1/1/0.33/0.25/4/135/309
MRQPLIVLHNISIIAALLCKLLLYEHVQSFTVVENVARCADRSCLGWRLCPGILLYSQMDAGVFSAASNEGVTKYYEEEDDDKRDPSGMENNLRFSGVGRLYSNNEMTQSSSSETETSTKDTIIARISSATVAVIGLGGVGSWAAEALVRSGIGSIVLVDLDDICISNTNRQLHAMSSTVGMMKIDEMKRRLLDINPASVIDAIDGMYEKTALILACVDNRIPIVTCGGAAGRRDPTKIVIDDFTKVQEDRLLFKCRKLMRQEHGFPKVAIPKRGKKERVRNWKIWAVYSTEVQQKVLMGLWRHQKLLR